MQELVEPVFLAVAEIWRAFLALCNVLALAVREVWHHSTIENVKSMVATAVLIYVFPEVCPLLIKALKKYVG